MRPLNIWTLTPSLHIFKSFFFWPIAFSHLCDDTQTGGDLRSWSGQRLEVVCTYTKELASDFQNFRSIFSLFFASNFSLRFKLVIVASKRNTGKTLFRCEYFISNKLFDDCLKIPVLGSIPAPDTVESEGRQMKQCWMQYIEKLPKFPLTILRFFFVSLRFFLFILLFSRS